MVDALVIVIGTVLVAPEARLNTVAPGVIQCAKPCRLGLRESLFRNSTLPVLFSAVKSSTRDCMVMGEAESFVTWVLNVVLSWPGVRLNCFMAGDTTRPL